MSETNVSHSHLTSPSTSHKKWAFSLKNLTKIISENDMKNVQKQI